MFKGHVAMGTVEGTGSAINIQTGFTPNYVELINEDDPTTLKWHQGMGAGHGLKLTDAPALTKITSDGISVYDGTSGGDSAGFTIGADSDVNVSGQTLYYLAFGDD